MQKKLLTLSLVLICELYATETFTLEEMRKYLTPQNPYIYKGLGQKQIMKEQLKFEEGVFDTKLLAKYDEKEYPDSTATYYSASLEKPTESGVDLTAGYRYAHGVQEFNNIKTAENGEFIAGVKIPIIAVLNKIDERRVRVGLTKMDVEKREYEFQESMRAFYFKLLSEYYLLLRNKSLLEISEEMLVKVEKRRGFLESNVARGNLPEIALLEASQQVIQTKQTLVTQKAAYQNKLTELLTLLGISQEKFDSLYHLPSLQAQKETLASLEESRESATNKRADFKIFDTEIEKLHLENKNNERKKYPELNLGLYGVQDMHNESGFKLSLDMSFPLARTEQRAKSAQIQEHLKVMNNEKEMLLIELTRDLQNIINTTDAVEKNLKSAKEEVILLERLEAAERRKYELGSSTLFLLNQREMLTMQAKRKLTEYTFEYQLLLESYRRIINTSELHI
jgi:outer membrane protein TolC